MVHPEGYRKKMINLSRTVWFLVLMNFYLVSSSINKRCVLSTSSNLEGVTQPGDVMFGFVVPLHLEWVYQEVSFTTRPPKIPCTTFHIDSYQQIQALIFAVEEINNNPNLLPNTTLGFQVYDSCDVLQYDLEGALQILTGSNTAIANYRCLENIPDSVLIGAALSSNSVLLAHVLGLFRYPQISHFATSSLLSDRIQFPSFFRTVPSDTFQSQGLAQLVLHFGWTWVGLLASDNDYGQLGIQRVKQELIKAGSCVAFSEYILLGRPDRNAPHVVKTIKDSTAKVVVVFSSGFDLLPVLDEMLRQDVTGKTFIASEGWSTTALQAIGKFSKLLFGTVGLAIYSGNIPGLKEYLNNIHPETSPGEKLVKVFWEKTFSCQFSTNINTTDNNVTPAKWCTGGEDLNAIQNVYNDMSNLRIAYNIYVAIHVVAKALEDFRICGEKNECHVDFWNFKPWQLVSYLKNVRVTLNSGREIYFNDNGDQPAVYDIVNWQLSPEGSIQQVKIGSYDTTVPTGHTFSINANSTLWSTVDRQAPHSVCSENCPHGFRKASRKGQPVCCYECVSCPPGEISNQTDSLNCFRCPWDQWPNPQKSRCLPKPVEYLSYDDPMGVTLAAVSTFSSVLPISILKLFVQHKSTPIIKANNYFLSCLLLLSLTLCFICPLAFIGFPQPEKCFLRQTTFGLVFALCVSCILAKTVMVVFAFMATKPGNNLRKWSSPRVSYLIIFTCAVLQIIICVCWLSHSPPFPQYNILSKPGLIIVECNEGSPIAFWTMLGYLFLLATVSFIVAFLARRLPDSFNEAQFITFSMMAFLSVWISYIPASLSAQGKYTVAMEIFAILASSWALVICMFLPKCFIILFKPNMNSRKHLMRRD
ncbi:extracellular calcium-sensing receptor-like [Mantella aurantiaca]